jgi:hypothetical protein
LIPSSGSVDVGGTRTFTAAVSDVVGTVERVRFSSSNTSIAAVSPTSRMDGSYICSDTSSITVNAGPTSTPMPTPTPAGCVWVQGECWDAHIMGRDGHRVRTHDFVPPSDPGIGELEEVILETFWQWSGYPDQLQTNEDHRVDTPFGVSVCNDLGDVELEDQWLDCVPGPSSFTDFWTVADGNVPVTVTFTGDNSSPGSHHSRVCAWWCTLPPPPPLEPTPTPLYCEQPVLSSEFICLNETGGSFTFDNVDIPQGASITDARLNLYARERFGNLILNIGAEGVGAQASWSFTPGSGWNQSSPFVSVIQAVVAQPGWNSGDSITILVTDNGSGTDSWSVSAWDLSPSEAAQLTVNYDVGGVFNGQVNESVDDYSIGLGADFYNYGSAPLISMGGQSVTVNWSWLAVDDSMGLGDQMYYQFQLAQDSSFTNLILDTGWGYESTEVTTPGLEEGETYWARVRTHDHCATSPWTTISETLNCDFATPCEIILTGPSSVTLLDTQMYRVQINRLVGTIDRVDFTSSDFSVGSICDEDLALCPPGSANDSDSDATYRTNLTAYSFGTTTISADMIVGGLVGCSASLDVGITNPPPWWQAVGGSVVAGRGSINSSISAGCVLPVCNPFIVLGGSMPIAGTTINPGSGGVSESSRFVEGSPYEGDDYDYSHFRSKLRVVPDALIASTADETTFTSGGALLDRYHYYSYDGSLGDLDIGAINSLASRRVVLFVTGAAVNLNQNIDFLDGSELFMIITNDDINVNETVTSIEGIYAADGDFNTCVDGTGADCSGTTSELTLRGTVVANQVDMNRDLLDNSQAPAEVFEFSPATFMGFPWALGDQKISWKEVAP